MFNLLSFVTSLSLLIAQKLTPENVLGVTVFPPILSKRDETYPYNLRRSRSPFRRPSRTTAIARTYKGRPTGQEGANEQRPPVLQVERNVNAKISNSSSKYFVSKEKIPRLEKQSKPRQGVSKFASFDTILAVGTLAVTFFFLRRTCSCRLSASLSSHLTPDQAGAKHHHPSTQQKSLQTAK